MKQVFILSLLIIIFTACKKKIDITKPDISGIWSGKDTVLGNGLISDFKLKLENPDSIFYLDKSERVVGRGKWNLNNYIFNARVIINGNIAIDTATLTNDFKMMSGIEFNGIGEKFSKFSLTKK